MATTYEQPSYLDPAPTAPQGGDLSLLFTFDNRLDAVNDVDKVTKLPKFYELVDAYIDFEQLDSNGTPTGDIALKATDGTTTIIIVSAQAAETAALVRANVQGVLGTVFTNDDWYVYVEATTAMATTAAGEVKVCVTINDRVSRNATVAAA